MLLLASHSLLAEPGVAQKVEQENEQIKEQVKQQAVEDLAEKRTAHFNNIDELVALRAPGLALNYLQREQVKYNQKTPAEWLYWEQKHIALLVYMQRWQEVYERIQNQTEKLLSHKVATADRNWFFTEQLRALIELKQYQKALDKSRQLLWNASSLVGTDALASWRRIIIRVYLNQGKTKDAQIAMRRYQQDYGELQNEDGVGWLQLQAELLIQLKQYNEAIRILKQIDTIESQALVLIAKLKAGVISPVDALDTSQLVLASLKEQNKDKALFQYVAIVSSIAAGEIDQAIYFVEALLAETSLSITDSLMKIGGISIDADTLWDFYLAKGNEVANRKGLLKGNDAEWYALASNLFQLEGLTAKSLFSVLALQAQESQHRELAMKELVKLIESNEQSLHLVYRLFTESKYFQSIEEVPAEVRYLLIDYNLSRGDVKAAANLMANLQQPPKDQQQFDWSLRRARVLILSGSFKQGAEVLREMLNPQQFAAENADKYLQVVFDLQAVEQHRISLDLFNRLQALVSDVKLQRELIFWRAESYAGLKQYDFAAYLFLKSAQSPENAYDPWYHTATFRAAESLLDAGLYEDARQRFLHLLKITENAARKAVIRQRLQTVQLKRQIQ